MKTLRLAASAIAVAALCGCSTLVAPPYSADYSALDALKKQPIDKVSVAPFQPRDPNAPINQITLRASKLGSPDGGFAQYLEKALVSDLREISAYDEASKVRIDATVLKNTIDVSGFSTGTGLMEVQVVVTRAGAPALRKTYVANTTFESSFAGAVAIPKGQQEYGVLVRTLLAKVYADPEFINAIRK